MSTLRKVSKIAWETTGYLGLSILANSLPTEQDVLEELEQFMIKEPNHTCVPVYLSVQSHSGIPWKPKDKTFYQVTGNFPINPVTLEFIIFLYQRGFLEDFVLEYGDPREDTYYYYLSSENLSQDDHTGNAKVSIRNDGRIEIRKIIDCAFCTECGHILSHPRGSDDFSIRHCFHCEATPISVR